MIYQHCIDQNSGTGWPELSSTCTYIVGASSGESLSLVKWIREKHPTILLLQVSQGYCIELPSLNVHKFSAICCNFFVIFILNYLSLCVTIPFQVGLLFAFLQTAGIGGWWLQGSCCYFSGEGSSSTNY